MDTKTKFYPLDGGLDVVTPAIEIKPGYALAMQNFEPWFNGGYRRIDGYERYDGHPKPSEQTFIGFNVSMTAGLVPGNTVTGVTSGATGVVNGVYVDDGTFGHDVIAVTKTTGTFLNGESANAGAFTITSDPILRYSPTLADPTATSDLELDWLLAAQNMYRTDILVVPGSGDVRGAWQRKTNVYAIRDNAGATAGVLFKSSAAGWTTTGITMTQYVFFSGGGGGTAQPLPAEGDAINGQTSGAAATVHRVVQQGGATATNDAFGYLVLRAVTGTFTNAENLRKGVTKFAVAASGSTQFAFPVGGTYRFVNHNFFAGAATYRTYGVNGVGPAFEIDENNFVSPILMPLTPLSGQPAFNTPYLVEEHLSFLFLGFPGGTFQNSVAGQPLVYNGFLGAAEFGVGAELTGMLSQTGGVLIVFSEQDAHGLFGQDTTNWQLKIVSGKKGNKLYSASQLDTIYSLDSIGISSLQRTQAFGDFAASTISQRIQPVIEGLRTAISDSSVVRAANQYRLYFTDGSSIVAYVPQSGDTDQTVAATGRRAETQFGFLFYPIAFKKVYNTEDENGVERSYVCSSGGFVYEDRKGDNFDGAEIQSFVKLAFNHVGSPSLIKKFRRLVLEINSRKPLHLKVSHDIAFGSSDYGEGQADIDVSSGGGSYDFDNWDECFFDSDVVSSAQADLGGSGENIGISFYNQSAIAQPFILQGITLHYDPRRLKR